MEKSDEVVKERSVGWVESPQGRRQSLKPGEAIATLGTVDFSDSPRINYGTCAAQVTTTTRRSSARE